MLHLLIVLSILQTPDRHGGLVSWGFQDFDDAFKALRSESWYQPSDAPRFFREAAADLRDGLKQDEEGMGLSFKAHLLRWLGHARLLSDDLPGSIAAYRRGLALDPDDDKLHGALKYARAQVQYSSPEMQPDEGWWSYRLSLRRYAWIAFGCYCIGWVGLTRWWMVRRRAWLMGSLVGFGIAAIPSIGTLLEWRERVRNEEAPVVVIGRKTIVRRGNADDYPARLDSPLPLGAEVRRLFERNGWLQVELANGVVGWVPQEVVVE